jgi:hypothetical protein
MDVGIAGARLETAACPVGNRISGIASGSESWVQGDLRGGEYENRRNERPEIILPPPEVAAKNKPRITTL